MSEEEWRSLKLPVVSILDSTVFILECAVGTDSAGFGSLVYTLEGVYKYLHAAETAGPKTPTKFRTSGFLSPHPLPSLARTVSDAVMM